MKRLSVIILMCLMHALASVVSAFYLNVEATPPGGGMLNTSGGTFDEGESIRLRASVHTGFRFDGWYEDKELLSGSQTYDYTMPARDVALKAVFVYEPGVPADPAMPDTAVYYTFAATVSPQGAGSLNISTGRYAAGASIGLRVSSHTGFVFRHWQDETGEVISEKSSFNFKMPAGDARLTAVYSYDPSAPANPEVQGTLYGLTVKSRPEGGGTFNISSLKVAEGDNVRLYAYTNTGFRFVKWEDSKGNPVSEAREFNYVMPHGGETLYGVFEFDPAPPSNPAKNFWNKELGELIIDDFTPGNLNRAITDAISGSGRDEVSMITVSGVMNGNDFGVANNYLACTLLDLGRVTGITEIPSYAFDYTSLESVTLPATVEKIGGSAFAECGQLSSLTILSMTPPVLERDVFKGVPEGLVVYVPSAAIPQYADNEDWKGFTILPITEDLRGLTVSLPEGCDPAPFAGMWLELTNLKNGQRMHYVLTDRTSYTFANLMRNTSWKVELRNERGDVFGLIEEVEIKDDDVAAAFKDLSVPQTVAVRVLTPEGRDVTELASLTWTDAAGNYISQSATVARLPIGMKLACRMVLPKDLSMVYQAPDVKRHVVKEGDNTLSCTLTAIPEVALNGLVKDSATGLPLAGAFVTASQTFGGKYGATVSGKTDKTGAFSLKVADVPTSLTASASDYVSGTLVCDTLMNGKESVTLPDLSLKPVTGAVVSIGFTYRKSVASGEDAPEMQDWYGDTSNITYSIFNKTKQRPISNFSVQYPAIVLLEEVDAEDILEITASSLTSSFTPVASSAIVDNSLRASAVFDLVEPGSIMAAFSRNANPAVVASLYDSKGKLVKTYSYGGSSLKTGNLPKGAYTLVTMGESNFFNTIYDLSKLSETGLEAGADYAASAVEVKDGVISLVDIDEVPTLDESKLYYTGSATSFSVNKPSIVAGNYLTLTGRVDFKGAYASEVGNVSLLVDLPESCSFVENSVMVGNSTSSYTLDGNRLTVPLARYTDRVRFCVIPTLGGDYAPSAFVRFDLDGKTVTQPIGSARYTAQNLSLSVPGVVDKTTVPVSGTSVGKSTVEIYDGDMLIGQTQSLANGSWSTTCELVDPYNLSTHQIHAKVTSKDGVELRSETVECTYDSRCIEPLKVTMINVAHPSTSLNLCEYVTVFDFTNPSHSIPAYWYWPNYPDFTFLIEFTSNDPDLISDVKLNVLLSNRSVKTIVPSYDEAKECWIAVAKFDSYGLPVNVNVSYNANTAPVVDEREIVDAEQNFEKGYNESLEEKEQALNQWDEEVPIENMEIFQKIEALLSQEEYSEEEFKQLIKSAIGDINIPETEMVEDLEGLFKEIDDILSEVDLEQSTVKLDYEDVLEGYLPGCDVETQIGKPFEYSFPTLKGITSVKSEIISNINEDDLIEKGFSKFDLSDGNAVYTFCDDDTRVIIDGKRMLKLTVSTDETAVGELKAMTRGDSPFCIGDIESCIHSLSSLIPDLMAADDPHKVRHLLGDFLSMLKSLLDFSECVYTGFLQKAEDLVEAAYEAAKGILTKESDQLIAKRNDLFSQIKLREESRNKFLEYNIQNEVDIAKLEKQLAEATSEEAKAVIKQRIDLNKTAIKQNKETIRTLDKDIGKLFKKVEKVNEKLFKIPDRLNSFKEALAKSKHFLSKLPRTAKAARGWKALTWTGKVAKVVGTTVGAALQIIPFAIDILDSVEQLTEWLGLLDDILAKYPCKADREGWNSIFWRSAVATIAVCEGSDLNLRAQVGAMVLDVTNHPYAWLGSLVLDVYSWCLGAAKNKFHDKAIDFLRKELKALKCKEEKPDKDGDDGNSGFPWWWPFPDVPHVMDPSGFVYEGVMSNRVEGVTATIYYKEMVEDMYGDLHENVVKWDAAEYAQENPLFTDENGDYRWDVPQGLWQVKFEKEGYETTYSDWLPVPPPQLDVNIAMKQNVQPNVKSARAFEDAVEVEFDKYMQPSLLNSDNVVVLAGETPVEGTVTLLDEEESYEGSGETFASKARFVAAAPFDASEVTLLVKNRVKSYADVRMQDDFMQSFKVELEVRKIECDSVVDVAYGGSRIVKVMVLPAAASAGKTLNVRTTSSMVASTDVESVVIAEDGSAEIPVNGELPGTSALILSVDGYDITSTTVINVKKGFMKTEAPKANIASGSTVEKGTEITLSCATEGATIVYTLDGSCPCDDTEARTVYDGTPIMVDGNVTIKAIAYAPDLYESDIVEFTYYVDGSGVGEITSDADVRMYPLPMRETLNITVGGGIVKKVAFTNIAGATTVVQVEPASTVSVDVSTFPAGIYIVAVETEGGEIVRKVMKVK